MTMEIFNDDEENYFKSQHRWNHAMFGTLTVTDCYILDIF